MSTSSSIPWIKFLLFGEQLPCSRCPPEELEDIFFRMELERLPWKEMGRAGGLTRFPLHVRGDLDTLLDHIDQTYPNVVDPPPFQTGTVRRFFDHLSLLLTQKSLQQDELSLLPAAEDRHILHVLTHQPDASGPFQYQSASFWGELTRRMMKQRRPMEWPPLPCSSSPSSTFIRRLTRLYNMFNVSRGEKVDPFTLHLVPHSEHVDAVHWQSSVLLGAFVRHKPKHPLSVSIRHLVTQSVDAVLKGERPSLLATETHPQLDSFLSNIHVVHDEVPQVERGEKPPKTIDVFQRLLALANRDTLWRSEPVVPHEEDVGASECGIELLLLTERLLLAERQTRLVMQSIPH